jgi:hypothetical protein
MTLAWYDPTNHHVSTNKDDPLFTPLGQVWPLDVERKWVGLKAAEIHTTSKWVGLKAAEIHTTKGYEETRDMYDFARAIEAKLKEKNNAND